MKPMPTILVVDDEPNYLIVLSELLRDEGFEVFTAPGADEAMAIVREVDLDLVITDMQMPDKNGSALMEEVKDHNPDLPVIIITAYAEVDKAVAAMQAGAFSYLAKPFSNDELIATIDSHIRGSARTGRSGLRDRFRLFLFSGIGFLGIWLVLRTVRWRNLF